MDFLRKRPLLIGAAAVAAVVIAVLAVKARGSASAPGAQSARPVAVARVQNMPLSATLTLSGEFKPFQEVDLHAKVAGYIRHIFVDVGDKVRAGQVIADLEVPELVAQVQGADAGIRRSQDGVRRAQSDLERARSVHEAAHFAYTRLKEASDSRPGLIARQELDDAQARDKESEAQVASAEAALSGATQELGVARAGQQQMTAMSNYSHITAPFAGVVTRRFADTGSLIQAGTSSSTQAMPLVRLAEVSRLRLVLPVPESAVPRIHLGTTVQVRVPALERTFEGRVARFADDLDRQTRSMETEIDVPNTNGSLVSGMYAETVLELARKESALTVPVEAVSRNGSEASVLVVGADRRLEARPVKIGMEGTRRVEILAGARPNELVVIGSRGQLRPGDTVQPILREQAAGEAGGKF
jgi:RND family efflux transporter MFP subunit